MNEVSRRSTFRGRALILRTDEAIETLAKRTDRRFDATYIRVGRRLF